MEWKEEEALVRATRPYDQNGNAISKANSSGTTNYAWDFENRLTSVTLPNGGGVVSFKYDPFGRRIEKSGPSGTTIYAYDGANVSEELTSAGSPSMRYVQGAGIDEPLAESSTSVNYFSADGLGSITSLEDTTGTPQATFVYGAFGVLRSSTGSATSSYRYTAREYDQDTGLYYYRARYYDASNGRFLSQDPIGFAATVNWYVYVANEPTIQIDPVGLRKCKIVNGYRVCLPSNIIEFIDDVGVTQFQHQGCPVIDTTSHAKISGPPKPPPPPDWNRERRNCEVTYGWSDPGQPPNGTNASESLYPAPLYLEYYATQGEWPGEATYVSSEPLSQTAPGAAGGGVGGGLLQLWYPIGQCIADVNAWELWVHDKTTPFK